MARQKKEQREYIIELPDVIGIPGYDSVPKKGKTTAGSKRKAVSNLIFRNNPEIGALVIHRLDTEFGGVEKYATPLHEVLPNILMLEPVPIGKTKLDAGEKRFFWECFLADELAKKDGSKYPGDYLQKAKDLLSIVYS